MAGNKYGVADDHGHHGKLLNSCPRKSTTLSHNTQLLQADSCGRIDAVKQWNCVRGRKQVMHVRMHSESRSVPVGISEMGLPPSFLPLPHSLSLSLSPLSPLSLLSPLPFSLPPSWSVQEARSAISCKSSSAVE